MAQAALSWLTALAALAATTLAASCQEVLVTVRERRGVGKHACAGPAKPNFDMAAPPSSCAARVAPS